jgi:TetR/AcrR family transcriptional regulator, repressor for neighboring sulfatase
MDTNLSLALGPRSAQRLLAATRELLAEKPAADVTVREIAARAGVQHTLIRRHFGSRDALLSLVVAETLSQFAEAVDAARDLPGAVQTVLEQFSTNRALASGMAVLVLGQGLSEIERFPLADALERQLLLAGVDRARARDTAVVVIALTSGWAASLRFWLSMAGRRDDPSAARDAIERAVWALIEDAMHDPTATRGTSNP